MDDLGGALERWRRRAEAFRWEVPDPFNFGRDVVDRFGREDGRPALWWRGADGTERRHDFAWVARESDRMASLLAARGVRPGDPVIVLLPKRPEWQVAMVGAIKAGALVIPGSTALRPKDLLYRARHSAAVALVIAREQLPVALAVRGDLPALRHVLVLGEGRDLPAGCEGLEDALARDGGAAPPAPVTRAADPALVYYTSGTTGPPKAVLHAHAWTFAQRYTAEVWLGLRDGDRIWTTSDTGWAKAAYSVLFGPWSVGAEVFLYGGRFEPAQELELLADVRPAVFCAPPTEFRLLVKEPGLAGLRVPGLRECVSAGEPLNPEVIRAWQDATGLVIRDGYGQTETILLVGNFPGNPVRPGSMGLPMPGHRVEVIDEAGRVAPAGEIGEVAVEGRPPSLFREYWKDPEATRRARRGAWYVTGDRAFRDADGWFWFVGRSDDVIISAGYRIGPFEVESALVEHPDVLEAAAVAAPDPDRGAIVKAYVVLRPGVEPGEALAERLKAHVKSVTAPYKYPRAIEFVDALPKTVSGKIRRVELRDRARADTHE
jgi:acetyl-CoA synthetase/medium-chain acyl-CoA synthetase